ncbi:hypothetical protein [Haloferula sp. BvORR071]|uniref:hypothetical protein n=1 Tax=Haloferula sp. BvORR071 TaxID=1396141 RepID=UPI00054CDCC5|nr:hypothetical protein [Haloferula sp. BvORR071]
MDQEPDEIQEAPGGRIPLGARLSLGFLHAITIILTLPTAGVAMVCLIGTFKTAAIGEEPGAVLAGIAASLVMLGAFCALFAILLGAGWMIQLTRAPHDDPRRARWPDHPLRVVAKPLLVVGQAYSVFAIGAWLTMLMVGVGAWSSWAWCCFWGAFGIVCYFLSSKIDRFQSAP